MRKEFRAVISHKGQITIPAEVRRALGLVGGDWVAIVLEDNQHACLSRMESVVAHTAGMLKSDKAALSSEELRGAAEGAIVDEAGERDRA